MEVTEDLLKGELIAMEEKSLEFDSDELDLLELDCSGRLLNPEWTVGGNEHWR